MKNRKNGARKKWVIPLISFLILGILVLMGVLFSSPQRWFYEREWRILTREVRKIMGLKPKDEVPAEEKRIREELILRKMDEAGAHQDWRSLAPEYPKPKRVEGETEEERIKAFRKTPEFQTLERELKDYLKKKEDALLPTPPVPSLKDGLKVPKMKDGGEEKILEKLMAIKEKPLPEKPLEENLQLGIKGALVYRKILERPPPPQVKMKVEAEIEMTLWVLPNGMVDRVIPTIKGDAELERIASQYLRQWRFAPLPRDQPQVEQSGTIPIKFKLQ